MSGRSVLLAVVLIALVGLAGAGTVGAQTTPPEDPKLSDPEPDDGERVTDSVDTVSVQVSPAIYDGQAINTTVNITFEGELVKSTTISTTQRVSAAVDAPRGGQYEWAVNATSEQAQTTVNAYSFEIPGTVELYDALDVNRSLVTGDAYRNSTIPEFTVEFFGANGNTELQTVRNGTVNLSGLIVEDPLSLRIRQANESQIDYATRNVYLSSIFEQEEAYLIPRQNASTERVIFELDDKTGQFSSTQSVLQIQRGITKDFDGDGTNETRFQTMAGDEFDVSNRREFLMLRDERYRLRIDNQQGRTRALGDYEPTDSVVEILEVGEIQFSDAVDEGTALSADVVQSDTHGRILKYRYEDADDLTEEITVKIVNLETGNVTHQTTETGPFGVFSETIPLNDTVENSSYNVTVTALRNDESEELVATVGALEQIGDRTGIPARILQLISWAAIVALMGLTAIFDDGLAAMLGWTMATALTLFGFIDVPAVGLAVAGGIALLYNLARNAPVR